MESPRGFLFLGLEDGVAGEGQQLCVLAAEGSAGQAPRTGRYADVPRAVCRAATLRVLSVASERWHVSVGVRTQVPAGP